MKEKINKKSLKKVLTIGVGFDIIAELSAREPRLWSKTAGMHLEN